MPKTLVSTIIPVFNRSTFLREAVASVLAQQGCDLEILIVDDGSTDDTRSTAFELAALHPAIVEVIVQPNAGPGVARQLGAEKSRGEFIQFLDSDDLLLPGKFAVQVAALIDDPDAGIAYGKTYTRIDGERQQAPAQRSGETHRTVFPALLEGRIWETSTPLYRANALGRIGRWPAKRQMEDWEFDAQAGAAGILLRHCDAWVAEYRVHGEHRLAHAWMHDADAMRDRLSAYGEILRHAQRAGVEWTSPAMQRYARTLFWMARNAGERGFAKEATELLALAQQIHKGTGLRSFEVVAYRALAFLLGWPRMGRLSKVLEGFRAPRPYGDGGEAGRK